MLFFVIVNFICLILIYLPSRIINSVMCEIFTSYFLAKKRSWKFGLFVATANLSILSNDIIINSLPVFFINGAQIIFGVLMFVLVVIARATIHMGND